MNAIVRHNTARDRSSEPDHSTGFVTVEGRKRAEAEHPCASRLPTVTRKTPL